MGPGFSITSTSLPALSREFITLPWRLEVALYSLTCPVGTTSACDGRRLGLKEKCFSTRTGPARRSRAAKLFEGVKRMPTKIINTLTGLVLLLAVAAPLHAGSILNHEMTV